MKFSEMRTDEDAVSPVIGVILMVAITVILAAVIATFVLGLGDTISNTSPQASFSGDYDSTNNDLTITMDSGESIPADELRITGQDGDDKYWYEADSDIESTEMVSAGVSAEISGVDGNTIRVIWEDPKSDSTATIYTWSE